MAAGVLGVLFVLASIGLMLVKEAPRVRVFLGLVGSTLVTGGVIAHIESKGVEVTEKVSGTASQALAGTAADYLGFILILVVVVRGVWKKKIGTWTTIGALLLPALAAAAGSKGGGGPVYAICEWTAGLTVDVTNEVFTFIGQVFHG